jgi:hypothetical protein
MWESPAVVQYNEGIFKDSRRVDIDGLEEARCATLVESARYLEGIRRYHDRNVKERSFNVGDLILHRIQNTEGLHKLSSPWEGPFTTAKVLTVKIRQPSHEFTFGVGMNFIPYPLVLTPVV